jgi:anti-sigma regulatory factor (Ser/Thr protein kinase)/DNA-binding response OmpR family regulator
VTGKDGGNREDEIRILVLAPTGRDALLAAEALRAEGLDAFVCTTMDELVRSFAHGGAGTALIALEALTPPVLELLNRMLAQQPPWSDLPLIILTGSGRATEASEALLQGSEQLGNATFLERPLRISTLVRAVRVALRARCRQYEIRGHLQEREKVASERVALMEQQRAFLRDVLASVTEGKLLLCDTPATLPPRLPRVSDPIDLTKPSLRLVRQAALKAAHESGLDEERADDLVTATNEAAMNAIVHAGGGTASIGTEHTEKNDTVQVWIEDQGTGIDMRRLPKATLGRGYSTAGTFGHGFWMALKTTDRIYLMTGKTGTTVVIEQDRTPPEPAWMRGTLSLDE